MKCEGKTKDKKSKEEQLRSFGVLVRGTNGAFRGPRKHRVLQTRPTVAFGGAQVYVIGHTGLDNRNSGLKGNDLFKTEFMGFFREKLRA